VSPHCFCPCCCCLPLLVLLPSAEIVYNAALAGSSAAAFSAVDAPLLHLLLTLLAAAAVLARGEMHMEVSQEYFFLTPDSVLSLHFARTATADLIFTPQPVKLEKKRNRDGY
jgi:hypothetical protein